MAWNAFGLTDLILAVSLGALNSGFWPAMTGSGPTSLIMSELPRSIVPTFLVPLFMLVHLLGLARCHELAAPLGTSPAEPRARPA